MHRYYKCFHTRKPRTCDKKNVKKEWIENIVINQTMNIVMNDAILERIADAIMKLQGKESTTTPALKKQRRETEKSIENMLNAIQAGIFTESTKKRLDDLEQRKSQLDTAILQEELQRPMLTKEQMLFWLHKFRTTNIADKVERQRLIDSFVNAVYLYDDKIVFVFNYKDGTKTVSLTEVEGSDLSCNTAP